MILMADLNGESEESGEARLELGLAVDLPADVANDAAKPSTQEFELSALPG